MAQAEAFPWHPPPHQSQQVQESIQVMVVEDSSASVHAAVLLSHSPVEDTSFLGEVFVQLLPPSEEDAHRPKLQHFYRSFH